MQAAQETLKEQLTRINAELAAAGRPDSFYTSLAQSWQRYGSLTERQEYALVRSLAQRAEREARRTQEAAAAQPVPEGRVQITGEVLSVKWQESTFRYHGGGTYKMLVKADAGWKVWGTVASDLGTDGLKGCRVIFTATVQPKEAGFGFFSRPTNARRLDAAQVEAPKGQIVEDQVPALVVRPASIACTNKPVFAARPALADIIAKARELEQRQNEADSDTAKAIWETDGMSEERPAAWINATTCE